MTAKVSLLVCVCQTSIRTLIGNQPIRLNCLKRHDFLQFQVSGFISALRYGYSLEDLHTINCLACGKLTEQLLQNIVLCQNHTPLVLLFGRISMGVLRYVPYQKRNYGLTNWHVVLPKRSKITTVNNR